MVGSMEAAEDAANQRLRAIQKIQNGEIAMRSVNGVLQGLVVIACGACLLVPAGFAQQAHEKTFSSPQHASNALYVAVLNGDQEQIVAVLGGDKAIVSTDDNLSDQKEREMFAQKYQEMHRLMRRSDGAMILYVGADNWPFPVPIVSKNGRWYFDANKGAKEVLYRRVGANEITAIETCHALVEDGKSAGASAVHGADDQALLQYAHALVSEQGDTEEHPFDGYYFRKVGANGGDGAAYVAYPAQYRSSGVMTFVVTNDDKVYEKDLGPKTDSAAKEMKDWKIDKSWFPAEE